ncbi:MAG: hypothetical protein RMJ28_05305 [Nitrososphaerota archaeon]|nr:hypothetical protein [Nitrososphaerota archaeon]
MERLFFGMSRQAASALLILSLLLIVEAGGIRYTGLIEYPPLDFTPADAVVDGFGRIWFALPPERAVGLYTPDVGLNLINLGFEVSGLALGDNVLAAYSVGESDVAFIELSSGRVVWQSEEAGQVDAVLPVDGGFVLVKSFPTMTLLTHVSPAGEVLWENRIVDRELVRHRGAAGSGRFVWLRTVDGNILMVELGREGYKEFRLGRDFVALASREGKLWAVDSDGEATRLSIRGVEAKVRIGFSFRLGDPAFALPGDRLVILSRVDRVIFDVVGGQVSREHLQSSFTLAALKGAYEVYLFDPEERSILVATVSRQPVLSDASATPVGDGDRVRVTVRVSDPDGDLAEGYPRVLGVLGTEVSSQEMSLSGGVYSAELAVPRGEGVFRVYVQALDSGGNEARIEVASYQVSGGSIASEGSAPTTPTQGGTPSDLSAFLPVAVELAFFAVLVTALTVFWLSRSRRGRRRRR